jgi:tetratricopeptide (TPR) repeat protein
MNHHRVFALAFPAACFAMALTAVAQPQLPLPQASPAAGVSQTIGITQVQVSYHRPAVKARAVWGGLVPYDEVWRAGANENTTIMFSKPVKVGGKDVPAGTYGLHMIPTRTAWTVILNKNATSWGSYFYKEAEDLLRITVTPQPGEFREWLQFEFSDLADSGAVLTLCWEKLRIPIPITVETRTQVLASAREEYLRGPAGFTWQGFNQAAQYALRNGGDLNEALGWANRSTGISETFANLRTKAAILEALGKKDEAAPLSAKAMKLATEVEINALGYDLMGRNKMKEAIEMFEKNVKDYPDSWNVYDSLAEGLEKTGDVKGAIQNYEKALKRVTDETNKKRITATITKLRSK